MILTLFFSHNYARIEIDSYDYLPLEKTLILDLENIDTDMLSYSLDQFLMKIKVTTTITYS